MYIYTYLYVYVYVKFAFMLHKNEYFNRSYDVRYFVPLLIIILLNIICRKLITINNIVSKYSKIIWPKSIY